MGNNTTVGVKSNFQALPGVPDNQKLKAAELNQIVDFQKAPAQQITGSLDDTDIVIDGTKQFSVTIVVAGSTRTITANASGHFKGNFLIQRYTFNVDCTITLSGFDSVGNDTGDITSIKAGTYDFKYFSRVNGINLQISTNITETNTWYVNPSASGGNGSPQKPFTVDEAMSAASENDIIIFQTGTYTSDITVTKDNLTFLGYQQNKCKITATNFVIDTDAQQIFLFLENLTVATDGITQGTNLALLIFRDCTGDFNGSIVIDRIAIYDSHFTSGNITTKGPITMINSRILFNTLTIEGTGTFHNCIIIADILATGETVNLFNSYVEGDVDCANLTYNNTTITGTRVGTSSTTVNNQNSKETIKIPIGARDTNHTTGTNKVGLHIDYNFTFIGLPTLEFDPVITAGGPTGTSFIVDINVADIDGANLASILSTELSVDAGEFHSSTAATPAVLSTTTIAQYKFISIDIDQIGGTIAGKGGFVTLNGFRT